MDFSQLFPLLRDERTVVDHWQRLVLQHGVQGMASHDARIVAARQRHGVMRLLTFNGNHFRRYPRTMFRSDAVIAASGDGA